MIRLIFQYFFPSDSTISLNRNNLLSWFCFNFDTITLFGRRHTVFLVGFGCGTVLGWIAPWFFYIFVPSSPQQLLPCGTTPPGGWLNCFRSNWFLASDLRRVNPEAVQPKTHHIFHLPLFRQPHYLQKIMAVSGNIKPRAIVPAFGACLHLHQGYGLHTPPPYNGILSELVRAPCLTQIVRWQIPGATGIGEYQAFLRGGDVPGSSSRSPPWRPSARGAHAPGT